MTPSVLGSKADMKCMQPYFFAARLSKRHVSSGQQHRNVHLILLSFVDLLIPIRIPVDVLLIIMAEAIGVGASVIAFVGIAGQLRKAAKTPEQSSMVSKMPLVTFDRCTRK